MAGPSKSFQEKFLEKPKKLLEDLLPSTLTIAERNIYRLEILEKCSSELGGFKYETYCKTFHFTRTKFKDEDSITKLISSIKEINLAPSIVLSILSTEDVREHDQKSTGAFYTDFRLALKLAESLLPLAQQSASPKIIDLASGSGILLSSVAFELSKILPSDLVISKSIFGIDLSKNALRGSLLALSSMTSSIKVIKELREHLVVCDSLVEGKKLLTKFSPEGFDGVIGNPPWEKLKLNLYEYLRSNGHDIHYGQKIKVKTESKKHLRLKTKLKDYSRAISHWLPTHKGEIDLYMPFLSMAMQAVRNGGQIAQIVPASLIRNKSAQLLRKSVFSNSLVKLTLFDNKQKFFKIDSRFKFLFVEAKIGSHDTKGKLVLAQGNFTDMSFNSRKDVHIDFQKLLLIRPDLSIPEVRDQLEWELYKRISSSFDQFGKRSSGWDHIFYREIDMSLDKKSFRPNRTNNSLPVIEGRMIHQYRVGIKSYISGTGRKAIWKEVISKSGELNSQFFINKSDVPQKNTDRIKRARVAFCDITGQTNERTMLATIVPGDCICGNKVPTIDFINNDDSQFLSYLWVGIANSFVFDWLLRRTITTNANFFILDGIPVPKPDFDNPIAVMISQLVKQLLEKNNTLYDWDSGIIRAKIDALVASLYKISFEEFKVILRDFKSLDRTLNVGFKKSCTLTQDLALLWHLELCDSENQIELENDLKNRISDCRSLGAIPYVPSQFSKLVSKRSFTKKWHSPPPTAAKISVPR
jgi:Alw26I/Eco31I/Esp3I family type II restriction m6 adenine DNA methyltransferase